MGKTKDTTDNAASCAASTSPFADAIEWPEVKENRRLPVKLTVQQLTAASDELAETHRTLRKYEAGKKADADEWKAKITAAKNRQEELVETIEKKEEDRDVECEWIFECAGINETGVIYSPDYKTLRRCDTGAAVTTVKITDADRQTALPIAGAEPMAEDAEPETTVVDATQDAA